MKLLAFTIGGQKIGVDIKSWSTNTLSGNTAFQAIADTGSTPTNYTDISSFNNWANFGGGILTPDQVKAEMIKLIPNVPTSAQYLTLESFATYGLNSISKVGSSIVFGGVLSGTTTVLTGTTSNAITGATNLGSGNAIFTSVCSSKLQLKSISGGTGISIGNTGTRINVCGCVFNWAGTTANGVGTYVSATCACSNPNMTFDGSSLSITGNIKASTYVCSPTITGSTKVCSPIVFGTTCLCGGVVCATTISTAACSIGTTCVCSPVGLFSTSSCSPIHCGACTYASTIVCSPIITGSTRVCSPIVCGTSCVTSPKFIENGTCLGSTYYPFNQTITGRSTTTTVDATYANKIIEATGTFTITFPNGMATGMMVDVINVSTGTITLAASTTINAKGGNLKIATCWAGASVYHRGSNVWVAVGDLTP